LTLTPSQRISAIAERQSLTRCEGLITKMSFLDDIRKQPRHHREIMFGFCVVTTISLVGMVWYNSFEKNLYVLLNPGENIDQRYLATANGGAPQNAVAENKNVPSLLGNISQTGKDLKAAFYNIFNLTGNDKKDIIIENTKANNSERVYTFPLSERK